MEKRRSVNTLAAYCSSSRSGGSITTAAMAGSDRSERGPRGGASERGLDQVFAGLETEFEANIARAEDEAASDLALSLVQDRSLPDALIAAGRVQLRLDDLQLPIAEIGPDHLLARNAGGEPVLVPLDNVVVAVGPTPISPTRAAISLVERLRGWSRRGGEVEATTAQGRVSGQLRAAGRDHVSVRAVGGDVIVAVGALRSIRLLRPGATTVGAGSVDEP